MKTLALKKGPMKNTFAALIASLVILFTPSAGAKELGPYSVKMWNYLDQLTQLGPRNPGSRGHRLTQDLIKKVGVQFADAVEEQDFTLTRRGSAPLPMKNITLKFNGIKPGRPILIGAHYDTRPHADEEFNPSLHNQSIIGANDGGSGSALLLGLAEYFKNNPPARPVHLVFFDGEDFGAKGTSDKFLGSIHYARKIQETEPDTWPYCVIVVDMIGDKDLQIFQEAHSMKSGRWLMDLLFDTAEKKNLPQFIAKTRYKIYDDHYPFIRLDIPSVVLIDFDYPHWHRMSDTLDKCSAESLFAVFSVVAQVVGEL
jgi:hypothetical protein